MVLFKNCGRCKEELPYYCFRVSSSYKDGLISYCKQCCNGYAKKRYVKLRYRIREQIENYQATHRNDVRASRRLWESKPENRVILNIKKRFKAQCKKHNLKLKATLGCTYKEMRAHIKSQWTSEMCWDNYGKTWEIDHIQSFNFIENKTLFNHYTNIRPLFKDTHLTKSIQETKKIKVLRII